MSFRGITMNFKLSRLRHNTYFAIPGEEQSSLIALMLYNSINHAKNIQSISFTTFVCCFSCCEFSLFFFSFFFLLLIISSCTTGFFFTSLEANTMVFQSYFFFLPTKQELHFLNIHEYSWHFCWFMFFLTFVASSCIISW